MVEYLFYAFFILFFLYVMQDRASRKKELPAPEKKRVCSMCGDRLYNYDDEWMVCRNRHYEAK